MGLHKLLPVSFGHGAQVADHPTDILELPIIGHADKTVIGCDIRKKWELPAAQGPEGSLAFRRTQTGQQQHVFGRLRHQLGLLFILLIIAFVATPFMPEIRVFLQIIPLFLVSGWDGVTDIAAEGFAARVVRRALLPSVKSADRRIKTIVKAADIGQRWPD